LSNNIEKTSGIFGLRGGKKKTKVTVFKEGRGNIFFYRVRFSMLKVQSNLQLYSSRSSFFLGVFNQPDKGYSLLQKVLIRRDDTKVGLLVRLKGSREGET